MPQEPAATDSIPPAAIDTERRREPRLQPPDCEPCGSGDNTQMLSQGQREPLYATLPSGPTERRQERLRLAPCAACGQENHLRVMLRTPYFLYVRCERCVIMWTVPKPGPQLFGK
jgi:hypothetical protein